MIYRIDETTSTNDEARDAKYRHGDIVWAERQTAGRGQRGHTWTSPEGENLTFSMVLEPRFLPVGEQFLLSEAVTLALTDTFAAFGIVTHGLCNELVLIDCSAAKALGEARDLDDGSEFQDRHVKVRAGDYADCKDADIVVITVGRKPPANSNRMAELGFTVGLVGEVVDNVMASGFDGVIVMVSNPVDVMAWYAWKRSGLPRTQVLGTGTALDTSRLKTIIGEETGLDPRNVGGFVMGEHGDSQFTAWSTVSLGGKPFARFLADNQDRFASVSTTEIEEKTRTRGNEIVAAKGGTNFGIASTVAGIVQTILWDERRIVPVSTLLDGEYGEHDVFLGVPTELRANGANEIVELDLSEDERAKLHHSAELVREHCEGLL